jgi:hypothetical protein
MLGHFSFYASVIVLDRLILMGCDLGIAWTATRSSISVPGQGHLLRRRRRRSEFIRNNLERDRGRGCARSRLTFATFDGLRIADPGPVL